MRDRIEQTRSQGGTATTRVEGDQLLVALTGAWDTEHIARAAPQVEGLDANGHKLAVLDLTGVTALDTNGALVVRQAADALAADGAEIRVEIEDPHFRSLLETAGRAPAEGVPAPADQNPIVAMLENTGKTAFGLLATGRDLLGFLGEVTVALLRTIARPWRIRRAALFSQMDHTGLRAVPIVGLLSFLIGIVLAYQSVDQLARFGAQIYTVNIVAIGVLREMGVLITAIIVAGRSGSAFTAQIGTMKVNQEIDALQTLGMSPVDVLVVPRVLGLILVMPLLVFYANIMGLLGGAVMSMSSLGITFSQFLIQLQAAVNVSTLFVGLIKAPLFAGIIAVVGCFEGMQVSQSAESVGQRTTRSVVEAIFLVIVLDAMLSVLFSVIGI